MDRGSLASAREASAADPLNDLERKLSACTDFAEVRALVAHELGPLLPVQDRASICFLEPSGEWLRIHRILPVADHAGGELPRVRVEGTPIGRVAREGVGRVVADVRTDPNITFGHASHDGIRSTVSVPVRIGSRVIGTINCGSRTPGACTDEMLARMTVIADAIGPAFYAAEQALAPSVPTAGDAPVAKRSSELVGSTPVFQALLAAARRAAHSDAEVLITGEPGTGKTVLARALHDWGPRRAAPFVTVHLADLAPARVEAELFGYETGASVARVGRFESAEGGTIFLDEIGAASHAIQTKLLRLLHDRSFERAGGTRAIASNVRIVAATNRDLPVAVRRGAFRADLFQRLSVIPLHVPALRDRAGDIEAIAEAILATADGRGRSLSTAARARLRDHAWPGNIRELAGVLQRAAVFEAGDELALDGLEAGAPVAADVGAQSWHTLAEHQRLYIEQVLAAHDGAIEGLRGAARVLGLPASTLRSRMKRLAVKGRSR